MNNNGSLARIQKNIDIYGNITKLSIIQSVVLIHFFSADRIHFQQGILNELLIRGTIPIIPIRFGLNFGIDGLKEVFVSFKSCTKQRAGSLVVGFSAETWKC